MPDGQDAPDFLSIGLKGPIGLELVELLDGGQMGPAKGRESQRDHIRRVLCENWQGEYQPQNFNLAVMAPNWGLKIARSDEAQLRQEFLACSANVDKTWHANPERVGAGLYHTDFSSYVILGKYFHGIRYIAGARHGFCWIDVDEDGGAYDPAVVIRTLENALDLKLNSYATTQKQTHLKAHGLVELNLFGAWRIQCIPLQHASRPSHLGANR